MLISNYLAHSSPKGIRDVNRLRSQKTNHLSSLVAAKRGRD
ncbi:MAG: hypothetical protein U5L45_01345 [Saprospiraceae bacterium]|nr:hypothetical protein [Saprospiraceae bacterium]